VRHDGLATRAAGSRLAWRARRLAQVLTHGSTAKPRSNDQEARFQNPAAAWAFGEHADRAHADRDLAGRMDDGGNLDPTPGEADVNVPYPPISQLSGPGEVSRTPPFLSWGSQGRSGRLDGNWRPGSDGNFGDAALSPAELTARDAGAVAPTRDLLLQPGQDVALPPWRERGPERPRPLDTTIVVTYDPR
jgi:hypothetical protein